MVLFKFLPLFAPLLVWLVVRHPDFETRRKRVEMLLVLMPFVVPVLLLTVHLISR